MSLPSLKAQDFCNSISKEAKKYFEQAEKLNFKGDQSYFLLKKAVAVDEDFAEALAILGEINHDKYTNLSQTRPDEDKSTANYETRFIEYYSLAIQSCPGIQKNRLSFVLGDHYYKKRDFLTAQAYLNDYVASQSSDSKNQLRDRAERYLNDIKKYFDIIRNPVPFNPMKVGGVSTMEDEYLPMLSPDNRFLFLTRRTKVNTMTSLGEIERELFVCGANNYNGSFEEGTPMPQPFNQDLYQGGSSISVDNKMIFITVINQINVNGYGFANGDIYYSELKNDEWSTLKTMGPNVNSAKIWEGQPSISADNKTLYFSRAINKIIPGEHYGLMDIYKTQRLNDGSWGPAVNLGPAINTEGNEKSPFMHSDSYTLYFSSDKHIGVGGFDIFYSKMDNDGTFLSVKNIGYPINTEEDEHGFIVSTDGHSGYFSSYMDDISLDIYSFELYREARPEKVVFVKGETISGKEALDGLEIKLKNVVTDKEVEVVIDRETGEYVGVIAVKEDEDVLMTAKKDGYAFTSQYISSEENVVGKPMKTNLEIKEIKKGESYKINDIVFATNSFDLSKQVTAILDEFGGFLQRNENIAVELHGHTDRVGNDEANQVLSEQRARAVYLYLIKTGVDKKRLSYKGFGPFKPVANNDTPEGRALNRRTEFLVISE